MTKDQKNTLTKIETEFKIKFWDIWDKNTGEFKGELLIGRNADLTFKKEMWNFISKAYSLGIKEGALGE